MRMLWRALIVAIGVCAASPAAAGVIIDYVGFGWGPGPVLPPPPNIMVANNQYFDLSVPGLEDLCEQQPSMCDKQKQVDALAKLERDRAIGWALTGVGFGIAVVGPLASIGTCTASSGPCQPNWLAFTTTLAGGAALGIAGLYITPTDKDVLHFVNMTNAMHPSTPVHVQFGMVDRQSPGFVVAGGF